MVQEKLIITSQEEIAVDNGEELNESQSKIE